MCVSNFCQVLLKPSLGYFCALDPLGYDFQQMDVMFMVLGSMVGGLTDTTTNDQQLKMIFCFLRTCQGEITDFISEMKIFSISQHSILLLISYRKELNMFADPNLFVELF